ncbi:phosphoserine aminotransferase, putative [Eimeria necatrix]|uniref:Phosphoserine aminotransferase, putative n=1 Tax=Eimeria necatrix TaxID=51315 RepID=U6MK62_9EIME|nr:phosphoserine aminotransferase, putative [Eimeria necatrix]CDJ63473.1 phosphoserine aminotransferase, putative [Eimeria necatrix]
MEDVQRELVDFRGWGISVMEMSHRGPHFKKVLQEAKEAATRFLEIPQTHNLLFMSGGATAQFAAEALNLLTPEFSRADYAITGYWSKYAMKEASMYGETKAVTDAAAKDYLEIDPVETWEMSDKGGEHQQQQQDLQQQQQEQQQQQQEQQQQQFTKVCLWVSLQLERRRTSALLE